MSDTQKPAIDKVVSDPDSRRDEILRRMLTTPPKRRKSATGADKAAPAPKDQEK